MMKRSLQKWLRVTGNVSFVLYALPFAAGLPRRPLWWAFVGNHTLHAALIAQAARREGPGAFSATSRYGGALGYATIAALSLTRDTESTLHRIGDHVLFGLFGFTIVHGYLAKGRDAHAYGPLAALWIAAATRPRATEEAARPRRMLAHAQSPPARRAA